MVTGCEVAGLVLAGFPIVIAYLKHYQEGFSTLQDWWKFRTEFVAFRHEISCQSLLFVENLEHLLSPIVDSDVEMDGLVNNPNSPLWHDPDMEQRLQKRLPKSYETYRDTIDDIQRTMDELKRTLNIKGDEVILNRRPICKKICYEVVSNDSVFVQLPPNLDAASLPTRQRWKREFSRIKFTLSKKKRGHLLKDLAKHNANLQTLLYSSDKLAPSRSHRKSHLPVELDYIWERARGLHEVVVSGWTCLCQHYHRANLLLEDQVLSSKFIPNPDDMSSVHFSVLFNYGENIERPLWTWQEMKVMMLEDGYEKAKDGIPISSTSDLSLVKALAPTTSRRVEFNLGIEDYLKPPRKSATTGLVEIDNLCQEMQRAQLVQDCLGYLCDKKKRRYAFLPASRLGETEDCWRMVTLDSLLRHKKQLSSPNKVALSRRQRYRIAVLLSTSLLQLHSTPWVGEQWNKSNILVRTKDSPFGSLDISEIYVSPSICFSHSTPQTDAQSLDSTASLLALGIMLLELCFGESLDDQEIREKYLGEDGLPNDNTDFATARYWQNKALEEGGPEFANAIRRCVFCAFGPRSTSLANVEFRDAVYAEVVQPLQTALRHFDGLL
ncbi:MAG: hypothetical protein M1813_002057 [Trichoglossum hirsutum]|nr:MAG: hypothetical protein M1813_002057 [Trichoglossum hirsutum]